MRSLLPAFFALLLVLSAAAQAPAPAPVPLQPSAEEQKEGLLTDTQGVDFKSYLAQLVRITHENWTPLIPREVNPPVRKSGQVRIRFAILPNGHVKDGGMVLEGRSGDPALDRAAWGAIQTAVYPPLPRQFAGPQIELRFSFQYNMDAPRGGKAKAPKARSLPGLDSPLGITLGYSTQL
jgi:TonB family protein